jgi:ATP-binding cassette subfamily C (CFTR/MRP) protein 1
LADHILLLGRDKTLQQGTYEQLKGSGVLTVEDQNASSHVAVQENQQPRQQLQAETTLPKSTISEEAQDSSRATGDFAIYGYYLKSIGTRNVLIFLSFCLLNVFASTFSHIWLSWWTLIDGRQIALYISIYFLLATFYTVGIGGYVWAISVLIGPSTGRKLHQVLLGTVMAAPLSLFTRTEVGSI